MKIVTAEYVYGKLCGYVDIHRSPAFVHSGSQDPCILRNASCILAYCMMWFMSHVHENC